MLLVTTLALPAQYLEVGDAGNLPSSAQVPPGTIVTLTSIAGTLTAGDVDMYLIEIANPSAFSASTVGGAAFDTQLFLFYPDGRGVTHDDDAAATLQSTITSANIPFPGSYLLAISPFNIDPRASGQLIWNNTPFSERVPDGPRRDEPVDQWTGTGGNGAYTITLAGCTRTGSEIVLPDNHHLTESVNQAGEAGLINWWRTTGGRFQVLYEGSHFTNAGVTGSRFIDKLMFRGEDGEPNSGGQSWANVQLRFVRTNLTAATLTNDFANNLAGGFNPQTTTIPTVTVSRSIGATPNNYNIAIDLFNSSIFGYLYNPTLGNLLIDVTMPTPATVPATSGPVMQMQDTTGNAAFVRGAGVNTANPLAATGTLTGLPPVVGCRIDPSGGPGGSSPVVPARNEFYSSACGGSPSAFYEGFLTGQPFDLVGLTLTPDNAAAPNFYTVTQGAPPFDATQLNAVANTTADSGAVTHALGFTFAYPGGTTTNIRPTMDGFVWLASTTAGGDFTITLAEFLGTTARLAPCWYDLDGTRNLPGNAQAGMHVLTTGVAPNRIAYVTWRDAGNFDSVTGTGISGHGVYNFQMAIFETTNVVEFRYGSMPDYVSNNEPTNPHYAAITGFSRGTIGAASSVDPKSRDLSVEVPFATSIEGASGNMGQRVVATPDGGGIAYNGRAFAGQTLTFDALNVPAGAIIGVQLLDLGATRPGVNIPGIHAAGCVQATSLSPLLYQVALLPPPTFVGTVPLVIPPGFDGAELFAQFAILDGLFGGPNLVTSLSNAIRIRIGRD